MTLSTCPRSHAISCSCGSTAGCPATPSPSARGRGTMAKAAIARAWGLIEAPLDSSGRGRGEERAPEALRAAGLAELFGARDSGALIPPLRDAARDPGSGVVALADLRRSSQALREAVR